MKKILIVDDHAVVRRGIQDILSESQELAAYSEASYGKAALKLVIEEEFDIILLDIQLPDQSGLELLGQIHQIKPNVPILIMSAHAEDRYALRAFKAGAAGYLSKDSKPKEFITAVHKVMNGGRYASPSLAEHMVRHLSMDENDSSHDSLSDREFEVLRLIGDGKTVSEIAEELSLSVKTISTYRTRILQKLNLDNTSQMIRYAIKNDLAD